MERSQSTNRYPSLKGRKCHHLQQISLRWWITTRDNKIRKEDHQKDKCKCFGIILGQCKDLTKKEVVKADKSFRGLERNDDVVGLLKLL